MITIFYMIALYNSPVCYIWWVCVYVLGESDSDSDSDVDNDSDVEEFEADERVSLLKVKS